MKKSLSLLLALCMILSLLCGCSGKTFSTSETDDDPPETTEPEETVVTTHADEPGDDSPQEESVDLGLLTGNQVLSSLDDSADETGEEKPYTIMIYMIGSDLESQAGCASADILEILESGIDPDKCSLLIYTGGSKSWQLPIPSECNAVWALNPEGTELEVVAATSEPVNMGNPAVLSDFINYSVSAYPAEQYGLICWDHGGGPIYGYGSDELFSHDGLTMSEMDAAMAATPFAQDKLSFIGFDACLMASIEIADTFSQYAEYLVASEEVEPGSGWDYSFLSVLNEDSSTEALLREILDTYERSMTASLWKPEYTLSCLDLSQMGYVTEAMDKLFTKMSDGVQSNGYSALAQARDATKRFGMGSVSDKGSSLDLVDLRDMLRRLPNSYRTEAQELDARVDDLVISQVSNVSGTGGVSIYYPYDNKNLFSMGGLGLVGALTGSRGYQDYISSFSEVWINGQSAADWSPAQATPPQQDGQAILVQLSDEQLQDLSAAYYTILIRSEDDPSGETYLPVLMDCRVQPDANGAIRVPADPAMFTMQTDRAYISEEMVWPVRQVEATDDQTTYTTVGSCVFATNEITGGVEYLQIVVSEDNRSGELSVQDVYATSDSVTSTYGKSEVAIENYAFIAQNQDYLYPTYDENHALLPYGQWEKNGYVAFSLLAYQETFWLEKAAASTLDSQFFCQIVLQDTQGNTYGTELIELPNGAAYETVELDMGTGTMTFEVHEEEAYVLSYSGSDAEVVIPAQVNGVSVTGISSSAFERGDIAKITIPDSVRLIGSNAFNGCWNLTEVVFPKSLNYIGSSAFAYTGLTELNLPEGLEAIDYNAFSGISATEVHLPSSLTYVGDGIFSDCSALTHIHMDNNGSFQSVDGVLLTADGKKLLQFPTGRSGEYTVPEGVETICADAFSGAMNMSLVRFPEGLREIGSKAFHEVIYLQELALPDSLERIGHEAFSAPYFSFGLDSEKQRTVDSVKIGPKVSWIGNNAFDGYLLKEFVVDENNPHYASRNGCLLNKSGTRLIHAPYVGSGTLEVPETVNSIEIYAFQDTVGYSSLIIPDSVVSIDQMASLPKGLQSASIGKGLVNWENMDDFLAVPDLTISSENPVYAMYEGNIYSKDMTILLQGHSSAPELRIPDGVVEIASNAFSAPGVSNDSIEELYLPASVEVIYEGSFSGMGGLRSIEVADDNPLVCSIDGLMYSKDGTILVASPAGKTGTIEVADGTTEILAGAFGDGSNLMAEKIVLPEGVKVIRRDNFTVYPAYNATTLHLYLPDSLTEIYPDMLAYADGIVVHCSAGSAAEAHAAAKGITVENGE